MLEQIKDVVRYISVNMLTTSIFNRYSPSLFAQTKSGQMSVAVFANDTCNVT